ncbi:MAG: AAA family ATPase [Bacteroidetes bacterium]|nr:AAA family ATPase [Bacteroidota bacterium]
MTASVIEHNKFITPKPIISVCGKGGVGKTVFSALLGRVIIEHGLKPLLLVDADPVGGLVSAIGEKAVKTLSGVRDMFIEETRKGGRVSSRQIADQLDYFILNALVERNDYSLLAMGHTNEKGCFCSANKLLRSALDEIISAFASVLIDAEAGIEQINRDVTGNVNRIFVVIDASQRSVDTLNAISNMVNSSIITVVANKVLPENLLNIAKNVEIAGIIPENEILKQYDRDGLPLWKLPSDNEALIAVKNIAAKTGLI